MAFHICKNVACGRGKFLTNQAYICPLQSLYKQMVEIFRTLGVDAVPGVGQPFDPNFHDAVMREQNDDVPDGTVLQEFRKGFRHGDKLLRPAMVKVRDFSCSQLKQAVGLAWQGLSMTLWDHDDTADHAQAVRKHIGSFPHSLAGVQTAQWAPRRDARLRWCGLAWQEV